MDRIINQHHSVGIGGELRWCESLQLAFQDDQSRQVEYGEAYFAKHDLYEGTAINREITAARTAMVARNVGTNYPILDFGCGSGTFLMACREAGLPILGGWDINPWSLEWLTQRDLIFHPFNKRLPEEPIAWTLWDVLEHLRSPHELLDRIREKDVLFLSLPIYHDLRREIFGSKHLRPDEHFYHFTPAGLILWLGASHYGFELLEFNRDEQLAGRDSIGSFAFLKK